MLEITKQMTVVKLILFSTTFSCSKPILMQISSLKNIVIKFCQLVNTDGNIVGSEILPISSWAYQNNN